MNGRLVKDGLVENSTFSIDLADQQKGVYFLNIKGKVVRLMRQ